MPRICVKQAFFLRLAELFLSVQTGLSCLALFVLRPDIKIISLGSRKPVGVVYTDLCHIFTVGTFFYVLSNFNSYTSSLYIDCQQKGNKSARPCDVRHPGVSGAPYMASSPSHSCFRRLKADTLLQYWFRLVEHTGLARTEFDQEKEKDRRRNKNYFKRASWSRHFLTLNPDVDLLCTISRDV